MSQHEIGLDLQWPAYDVQESDSSDVVRFVDVSMGALDFILKPLGLDLGQVYQVVLGPEYIDVSFYALNEAGRKFKIGDDIARGNARAAIRWVQ